MTDRTNDANFAAVAAIVRGDKIFLAQRSDTKQMYPGHYEAPGGHVQIGETFVDALRREVREELGVSVQIHSIVDAYTFESEGVWKAEVMYLCGIDDVDQPQLNPEDHQADGWFTRKDLDTLPIVGLLKEPLRKAFEMIGEDNE